MLYRFRNYRLNRIVFYFLTLRNLQLDRRETNTKMKRNSTYRYILSTLTVLVFLFACVVSPPGRIVFYDFNSSKYEVEKAILNMLKNDSSHSLPSKWKIETLGNNVERFYVYFGTSPQEVYEIGFRGDSTNWNNTSYCQLAIVGQNNSTKWRYKDELSKEEINRIETRFEIEILSKLSFPYSKSN